MFVHQRQGSLEVICGPMFSGKSEELIRRIKRAIIGKQKVQVFKPALDDRYDASAIASHSQRKHEAIPVKDTVELARLLDPEAQVVALEDHPHVRAVRHLAADDQLPELGLHASLDVPL